VKAEVPTYEQLMWPTLKALEVMGGSASISELTEKIAEMQNLPVDVLEIPHNDGPQTSFEYRCAWARTHLKYFGAVDNSERGVWSITESGRKIKSDEEVISLNKKTRTKLRVQKQKARQKIQLDEDSEEPLGWEEVLLGTLKAIRPAAFERLCQRLLREAGFSKVEVTGQSGDGGIDGIGVLKVNLLSFHVHFQCKRYAGAVSSPDIRNFRGAMVGRSDKGLFITTGRFTRDAEAEAMRDGAPAIDLIDGVELCELLKKYGLGVETTQEERVSVATDFFEGL